jgi:hypothetical protein
MAAFDAVLVHIINTVAPGRGVIQNKLSTDVQSPPPPPQELLRTGTRPTFNLLLLPAPSSPSILRVCISIHPKVRHGSIPVQYLFSMTLLPGKWHGVKAAMVAALNKNKTSLTLDILAGPTYASCDVIFLQEAAAAFVGELERHPVRPGRHRSPRHPTIFHETIELPRISIDIDRC